MTGVCQICGEDMPDRAVDTLARTIIGEARGQSLLDMLGVACVVRERVRRPGWWGRDWESVCKAPLQFSCWNDQDPNRAVILDAENKARMQWPLAVTVAHLAVYRIRDRDVLALFGVGGVDGLPTHYHDRSIETPRAWGTDLTEVVPAWESAFRWYCVRQGRPPRR